MPVTDLTGGDDWSQWLQSMLGGGGQLGGLEGEILHGAPALRPGPAGALDPPTIDLTANQMVPGRQAYQPSGGGALGFELSAQPQTVTPQSWQDLLNGRSGISGGAGGGMPPWLSAILGGNVNPYARAGIAAAGMMAPTPTANEQAPTNSWMQRPSGVGGMPGPQFAPPARPYSPTPQNFPMWPTPGAQGSGGAQPRGPLAAPIDPYGATRGAPQMAAPMPPPRPNVGTPAAPATATPQSRFVQVDRPNAPANGGPYGRGGPPQMTALDLSRLFRRGANPA